MVKLPWTSFYLVGIMLCFGTISNVSGSPLSNFAKLLSSQEALSFVTKAETELHETVKKYVQASWNYESNITDDTEKKYLEYKVCIENIHQLMP